MCFKIIKWNLFQWATLLILLIVGLYSCSGDVSVQIEPIDQELNERLLDGKGLDSRLYSRKDLLQYFEVSGSSNADPKATQQKIDQFISINYNTKRVMKADQITFLFYRHSIFTNYGNYVYETARETENGLLPGLNDNLLSRVQFFRIQGNDNYILRKRIVYNQNKMVLFREDSVAVK